MGHRSYNRGSGSTRSSYIFNDKRRVTVFARNQPCGMYYLVSCENKEVQNSLNSALASQVERGFSKILKIYKTNAEKNVLNG